MMQNSNVLEKETETEKQTSENNYKPPLFSDVSLTSITVAASYLLALSLLLSFFYKAGKYLEYNIPFTLLEINFANLIIIASILALSSLSAFTVAKLSLPPKTRIRHRTQKLTDFFAAITTLAIAFYFITIFALVLKFGFFPVEALYLFIIYGIVVTFYFMRKKAHLAYNLVSSGFIITLLVTSFYLGINIAKIENKLIVNLNDEAYGLVATYNDNFILSGYNRSSKRFNGKIKFINQNSYKDLIFILHSN